MGVLSGAGFNQQQCFGTTTELIATFPKRTDQGERGDRLSLKLTKVDNNEHLRQGGRVILGGEIMDLSTILICESFLRRHSFAPPVFILIGLYRLNWLGKVLVSSSPPLTGDCSNLIYCFLHFQMRLLLLMGFCY